MLLNMSVHLLDNSCAENCEKGEIFGKFLLFFVIRNQK